MRKEQNMIELKICYNSLHVIICYFTRITDLSNYHVQRLTLIKISFFPAANKTAQFLSSISCILLKIEEFQFPNFHRACHRRTAVAELFRIFKMTLAAIFSILNNVSTRRNVFLNFRMFTRENKPLFWQK